MLQRLRVRNFKSFRDAEVELPRLAVFFGPNAVGKSNLLEAIQALSRIGTQRTLADALGAHTPLGPIRGHPIEMFGLPEGGLPELLSHSTAEFSLEADLSLSKGTNANANSYRYQITVEIATNSGRLSNRDEFLSALDRKGKYKGLPAVEAKEDWFIIRRQSGGSPRREDRELNYAVLSDPRLTQPAYSYIGRVRNELADWRTYYLDPRRAMRSPRAPMDIEDIGIFGQNISPFLYKLKSIERKHFDAIVRTMKSIIPSIEKIDIDLDRQTGLLNLSVRQNGTDYSTRVVSEGTLRLLGLCAVAVNPWGGSLIAFEEPENGVHPRRIELIARLLISLSSREHQVIVTTNSPSFCGEILKQANLNQSNDIGLVTFSSGNSGTKMQPFDPGPLFEDNEIREGLMSKGEEDLFGELVMRGWIDE